MKITKFKEDITSEIANSFKNSIAIDTEATGLQIPERDKLSLIQICDENENTYIIQPDRKTYKAKIIISDERDMLLDTGGGILYATRSFKKPFVVVNPDTLWSEAYCNELKNLENLYFEKKKPCLLLVNKNLSFDSSFQGDFNLHESVISRDNSNELIFTGLQILDQSVFRFIKDEIFSMNVIWNDLIKDNSLFGNESHEKFYHLNTKEMYDKILSLKITD